MGLTVDRCSGYPFCGLIHGYVHDCCGVHLKRLDKLTTEFEDMQHATMCSNSLKTQQVVNQVSNTCTGR